MKEQHSTTLLQQVASTKDKKKLKKLLKSGRKEGIRLICEICLNLLKNRIKLSVTSIKALSSYKNCIRYLAAKGNWKQKLVFILKHLTFINCLLTPRLINLTIKNNDE